MSNHAAQAELKTNLRAYLRLWRYAKARGLSFALFYLRKAQAAIAALYLNPTLALLVDEPYALWRN